VRIVGKSRSLEMMSLGRTFDFEEALTCGIINHIFEPEDFHSQVMSYATQFLPPAKAAKAVGNIKRAVNTGSEMAFQDALALERELQQQLFESQDAKEGLAAYSERRPPKFQGK